ncbi:hypothetical protein BDR04DRAFT_1162468 [Suillus decipiens]|nr:hypothetical protein BDR04DRAFT_1162468 [Suillus decipiens]
MEEPAWEVKTMFVRTGFEGEDRFSINAPSTISTRFDRMHVLQVKTTHDRHKAGRHPFLKAEEIDTHQMSHSQMRANYGQDQCRTQWVDLKCTWSSRCVTRNSGAVGRRREGVDRLELAVDSQERLAIPCTQLTLHDRQKGRRHTFFHQLSRSDQCRKRGRVRTDVEILEAWLLRAVWLCLKERTKEHDGVSSVGAARQLSIPLLFIDRPRTSPAAVESPTNHLNAYPMVQPMKAVLYFDNADGFGEWQILTSTEAYKNLRKFRRADEKIFKIIVKKIKQLSKGHFSDDNNKQLNGPDAGIRIPIYEAKITRDLRLVYQIDCVPDQDGKFGEIRHILAMSDHVVGSPPLLIFAKGLIANQDIQHVFILTPQEQKVVECTTSCYILGRSGTGKTTTMLFKMLSIQWAWELSAVDMPKPRQIFVTKSRVLATKVEECFTKLLESLASAGYTLQELAKMKAQGVQEGLVDLDDLPESFMNIPIKYSELEDKHFPLFVTFDRLAKMIAADISSKVVSETRNSAGLLFNVDDAEAHDYLVTYDVFANQYWPHFPQNLTRNFSPWLVFSEFMGIVKGSEHALNCPEGVLNRASYLCLPHRSNPNFANQRGILYDIFEIYTKIKGQRRHYDVADRTHAILKVLRSQRFPGKQVDYLYVDEAQDNLLIDALLLRQLCRNTDGLFWAGDTAQTISAGSSFRFDDLKAFLYRVEQHNTSVNSSGAYLHQPTTFQLAINHRSHGGIVNCAHSVIELITKFWPNTIDNLRPEKGAVDGLKPVFFTGWDEDTVCYKQFFSSRIEFGAQQCILVRDDPARQKLREQVGEIGLIMTLHESKGLEFNDVLLYNFFEDSVVDLSRWRIVLNGVEGQGHAPKFDRDEARYAGVCSELKLLYLGITRARKNMWIVDKSDKSEPMRILWTSRNQVQNCTPGTDVPHLAVSSTPEEWASFGRSLFSHKCYSQAIHCFERANLHREVKVCEAYQLREAARSSVGVVSLSNQKRAFNVAADAFTNCGASATGNQKLQYYRNSADCYVRVGDDLQAAEAYLNAQEFEQAVKRYRKAGRFDQILHVINDQDMRANIPEETTTELWTVSRLFYCSRSNTRAPVRLFSTFDEELEFLEDYDLDFARASLLESHSRYYEAAELHLSENRPLEAVRALIKGNDSNSTIRAAYTILEYFWRKCSFRIAAKTALADEPMRHFIALADQLETNKLTPVTCDLISMFQNILRGSHEALEDLSLAFHKHNCQPAALLCLDHVFSRATDIRSFAVDEMQHFLQQFHAYARLLYQISTFPDPMGHHGIQSLFSTMQLSGDEFLIPNGTFLHSSVMENRQGITLVSEHSSGYTASRRNITQLLQQSIRTILKDKVSEINAMCCKSPVFSQCLPFLVSGVCRRDNCPQEHVPISKLDRLYYNSRVAIHIWQILILQLMYSAHPHIDARDSMRDWLGNLYEALNPPFFIQGSLADLDMSLMPLRLDGIKVVKLWIRQSFYSLHPFWIDSHFLTAVMRITSLSFTFDRNDAFSYISRAKCTVSGPLEFFRKGDHRYMVHDLLSSYQGATRTSISSGILYLLHVLDNRLHANLSVLCDCIEDICSTFVIKYRMDPDLNRVPLHDIVLPCNWLLFPHKFTAEKETKLLLMGKLLDEIASLVEALRSEVDMEFLWLNHTQITPVLRNVFISRMVLCLIAHNIRNRFMRDKVDKIILSLHKNNSPSNWHIANYRKLVDDVVKYMTPLSGRAPPSDGYLRALLAFDNNKGVSNMVHLVHKKMNQRTRVYIVRRLVYEKIIEIPHLLSSYAVIAQTTLRVEDPAFVSRSGYSKDRPEVMQHDEKEITEPQPREFEGEEEQEEDDTAITDAETYDTLESLDEALMSLAPDLDKSLRSNGPSVEEEEAARYILNAYRRYVRRRSSRAVNAKVNAIFMTCLKETQSSEWRPGYYNFLFLGPLPHLLVCLERGIALTRAANTKTKDLPHKESHEKLEELAKQRSDIVALLNTGLKLCKQLEPSSQIHHTRDRIVALKRGVLEVKEFMQRRPHFYFYDYEIDLDRNIFHICDKPFFSLECLPEDDAFIQYITDGETSKDHYGHTAGALRCPPEYKYKRPTPPIINNSDLATYQSLMCTGSQVALSDLSDILSQDEHVRVTLLEVIIGQCMVAPTIAEEIYQIELTNDHNQITDNQWSIAHLMELKRKDFTCVREDTVVCMTTHLYDERCPQASVSRLIDEISKQKDNPGHYFGIAFSVFHCAVVKVVKDAHTISFSHTSAVQFLPSFCAYSPSTPGITALARLGHRIDPALFQRAIESLLAQGADSNDDVPFSAICPSPTLPLELWREIAHYLSPYQLISLGFVSRLCREAALMVLRCPHLYDFRLVAASREKPEYLREKHLSLRAASFSAVQAGIPATVDIRATLRDIPWKNVVGPLRIKYYPVYVCMTFSAEA